MPTPLRGINPAPWETAVATPLAIRGQVTGPPSTMFVLVAIELANVLRIVIRVLVVPRGILAARIEQDAVGDAPEAVTVRSSSGAPPRDLIPEPRAPEDAIHEGLEVVARCRVAVQVDRSGGSQDSPHLDQPDAHHDEVRLHPLGMRGPRCVNDLVQAGVLVGNLTVPLGVHVVQCPRVLERRARSLAADRRAVVGIGVERRVEVDQVDRLRVHAAQDKQVVAGEQSAVQRT